MMGEQFVQYGFIAMRAFFSRVMNVIPYSVIEGYGQTPVASSFSRSSISFCSSSRSQKNAGELPASETQALTDKYIYPSFYSPRW